MAIYPLFETRAAHDEEASKTEGRAVYKDEDWVVLRIDGNTAINRPVDEWFVSLNEKVKNGKEEFSLVDAYKKMYEAFKEGKETPLNGTDIRLWPIVTKAQAENLIQNGLRTIEDLSVCDDPTLRRIGHGARELQNKAKAHLEATSGKAAEKIVDMEKKLQELADQNQQLIEALAEKMKEKPKGRPPKAA